MCRSMRFGISGKPVTSFRNRSPQVIATINDVASDADFPPCLLAAIAERESGCDPLAISEDGGYGLCQLTQKPSTFFGDWPIPLWDDAYQNLSFAVNYYLRPAMQYWAAQASGDSLVRLIAAEYNEGRPMTIRYHALGNVDIGTTNDYAEGVLELYRMLKNGQG